MSHRTDGFTLIELMIVVAIVGILAAIVIPQYQVYTGKAQLSEAITITSSRKSEVAGAYQNGAAPADLNGNSNGISPDVAAPDAGKYSELMTVVAGVITVVMKGNPPVSICAARATLTLTPAFPLTSTDPITWTCNATSACKPTTCS